jgi:hypothetical protein
VSACGGATCCWDHRCINAMAGYYRVDGWTIEDLYLNFFFLTQTLVVVEIRESNGAANGIYCLHSNRVSLQLGFSSHELRKD